MANRSMQAKMRKMRLQKMKGAKKIFPSNYNNTIKVSQGPDLRMSEYYDRVRTFGEQIPTTKFSMLDPKLQMEYKRLFQVSRFQKIHEYYNLRIDGQEHRHIRYYFGGGEHFFVQDFPTLGIRKRSVIYSSKEQAMLYYQLPNGIKWEEEQVLRASPDPV